MNSHEVCKSLVILIQFFQLAKTQKVRWVKKFRSRHLLAFLAYPSIAEDSGRALANGEDFALGQVSLGRFDDFFVA